MLGRTVAVIVLGVVAALSGAPAATTPMIDVVVHEGTSMAVAVSPED